jgi:hypothetical protein
MTHLALHVYFWGDAETSRLLTDCLGPAARELRDQGLLDRFWFTVFDTRGPHVIAILTSPDAAADEVRRHIGARLDRYLAEHPSTAPLTAEEIDRRHAECRGKRLSAIDDEPGFAPNNSYRMAAHPSDGYPFRRSAELAARDELWRRVQDVTFWAIDQRRARTSTAGAVRWIAWMDHALARAGTDPAEFWRYHAQTLLVYLEERLRGDEAAVLATLPGAVGERNRAVFDRVWDDPSLPPDCQRLVEIVLADDGRTAGEKQALLREVNHFTLAQLGQPVLYHIPLILYAWQRNLQLQPA